MKPPAPCWRASSWLEDAGRGRAVLQRRRAVVELDQLGEAAADGADQRGQALGAGAGEIGRNAAGHDAVHHQAMAEAGVADAQDMLAQDAAVGVHERERGVVADGADVAEMVGKALELRHQRAQEDRARRRLEPEGCLHRAREGDARRRPCCRRRRAPASFAALSRGAPCMSASIPLCT